MISFYFRTSQTTKEAGSGCSEAVSHSVLRHYCSPGAWGSWIYSDLKNCSHICHFCTRLTFSADRPFWHRQGKSSRATCSIHPRSWGLHAERSAVLQNCIVPSFLNSQPRKTCKLLESLQAEKFWDGSRIPSGFLFFKTKDHTVESFRSPAVSVSVLPAGSGWALPLFPAHLPRLKGQWELSEQMLQLEIQVVTGRHWWTYLPYIHLWNPQATGSHKYFNQKMTKTFSKSEPLRRDKKLTKTTLKGF